MSLIYDRRGELGAVPAAHALLVGVGRYSSPKMPALNSSVLSATAMANWLLKNDLAVPLSTCRLLISPPDQARLNSPGSPSSATIGSFLYAAADWRQDAASHRENIVLFYFTGLGFQRSTTEDLMLFEDFDDGRGPALRGAVAVDNLILGMAPGNKSDNIARTQLYFIDTDRSLLAEERYVLSRPTMIFDEYRSGPDDRSAVIFYATQPGEQAFEQPEKGSVFTTALLRCLDGEAATAIEPSKWGITSNSLIQNLEKVQAEVAGDHFSRRQVPVVGGLVRDGVIRYLHSPPIANLTVTVLAQTITGVREVEVEDSEGKLVGSGVIHGTPGQLQFALPSGYYTIRAYDRGPDPLRSKWVSTIANVQPGRSNVQLTI